MDVLGRRGNIDYFAEEYLLFLLTLFYLFRPLLQLTLKKVCIQNVARVDWFL